MLLGIIGESYVSESAYATCAPNLIFNPPHKDIIVLIPFLLQHPLGAPEQLTWTLTSDLVGTFDACNDLYAEPLYPLQRPAVS